jgi:hypothetical protein
MRNFIINFDVEGRTITNPNKRSERMRALAILAAATLVGCGSAAEDPAELPSASARTGTAAEALSQSTTANQPPLVDFGGPLIPSLTTYAIYWGQDFPSDLKSGVASLLSSLDGSNYLHIAKQYMRGAPISTSYGGSIDDPSAPTDMPSHDTLGDEVCKLVSAPDPDTLYIVFTSNAPNSACAWHDTANCNGFTFPVAYVPNQDLLLPSCKVPSGLNCNSYSGATAASADSVAHELLETMTDPFLNAWHDKHGNEIADKCQNTFQACVTLPTGTWELQAEWSNNIADCKQQ